MAATGARRARLWSGVLLLVLLAGVVFVARPRSTETSAAPDPDRGHAVGLAVGDGQTTSSTVDDNPVPQMVVQTEAPTTTGTTLPLPDPPPSDPYAPTPRIPIATITIPALKVKVTMLEGITLTAIDQGSGHWPGTPTPGGLGNMVVAGHRTLHAKPFNRLDELKPGDKVLFDTVDGHHYTYEVRGTIIVPANNIGLASQSSAHTATLFACHPKGQASQRIVAKLRLLGDDGKPVDADADLPPMDVGNRTTDNTLLVRKYDDGGGGTGGGDPLANTDQ